MRLFGDLYRNRKVFLTGHTGFKGSWLSLWLEQLGADLTGYALGPDTNPCHFSMIDLKMNSILGDIRNKSSFQEALKESEAEIVFHLAAQPLVRKSYKDPHLTYQTNIMGTVNLFEAVRSCPNVKAVVIVTTDKVYENREWFWGYRENDPMGGYDPYSSSKGCCELIVNSYRNSFFNNSDFGETHNTLIASARAGNVIGGGDWAEDRLVPDIMRSISENRTVTIRSPHSTRPWQHVLEPLSGYLLLGQRLLEGRSEFAEAWNFGPAEEGALSVKDVVTNIKNEWSNLDYKILNSDKNPHEAGYLKLDCSKANIKMGWKPIWNNEKTFKVTTEWYREYYRKGNILSTHNLKEYSDRMISENE